MSTPPPTGNAAEFPGVTYVMPVLNEVDHIEAAIRSLVEQDYEGEFEAIIALGPSVDGTNDIVARLAAADARIRPIENPLGSTPGGLNAGIRAANFDVVIRVDAHSVLPEHYTRVAVRTLLETGADNVGGVMKAVGETSFERAVASAYGSRLGLGGTQHHVGGTAGPAETAYLGTFRRERLLEVGLFDEGIKRGQDWELNRRLRATGGTIWFTPEIEVVYRPRSSLRRLVRQFVATGIWRGELARRFRSANGLRYFVPPLAVLGIVLGAVLAIIGAATGVWWLFGLGLVPIVLYAGLLLVASTGVCIREGAAAGAWTLVVLPCIHFGWGVGFLLGYLSLTNDIMERTGR